MASYPSTLQFAVPPGLLLTGLLLYHFVLAQTDTPQTASTPAGFPDRSAPESNTTENLALLSLSNILLATKLTWRTIAVPLAYSIHLPKLIYFPIKHATVASVYVTRTLTHPLYPILAPFYLALRIITAPILVPLLLLYRFAALVYPLYVFIGAATICGASTGVVARRLGRTAVDIILGVRSHPQVGPVDQKRVSPRRESQLRVRTR